MNTHVERPIKREPHQIFKINQKEKKKKNFSKQMKELAEEIITIGKDLGFIELNEENVKELIVLHFEQLSL